MFFEEFFSEQIRRIKTTEDYIPAVLIGNKIDLADQRQVALNEAEERAQNWAIKYIECSAKMNVNVEKIFFNLVRIVGNE